MLNPFTKTPNRKGFRGFYQAFVLLLSTLFVISCSTTPIGSKPGTSDSVQDRLSRIKTSGTSKIEEGETETNDLQQQDVSENSETEQTSEEMSQEELETELQETDEQNKAIFSKVDDSEQQATPSNYTLPPAIPRVRPAPEVDRQTRSDYKSALKAFENAIESKNFDEALTAFENIEQQHPELSGPRTNIGMIYMHQEKFADAEKAFQKALEINNENEHAWFNLGLCYRELGKFPEAKESYQKAIALNPRYAEAHYNLGVLAELYLQDLELAVQSFEHYRLANRQKDSEVDTWLTDLRNRLDAARKAKEQADTQKSAQTDQPDTPEQGQETQPTSEEVNSDTGVASTENQESAASTPNEENVATSENASNEQVTETQQNLENQTSPSETPEQESPVAETTSEQPPNTVEQAQ